MTEDTAAEISQAIERDCRRYPRNLDIEEEGHAAEAHEF
ncbi:MAG: hypothetical protein ACFWUC_02810 [Oscillospiraceae bacterium]|jgi:hypothetical protein